MNRRSAILLAVLLLLGGAVKLRYLVAFERTDPLARAPYGDAQVWLDEARRPLGPGRGDAFYKPPLTTAVLRACEAWTHDGAARVRRLQLLMGLGTLAGVFVLARRRMGDGAAVLALLLALAYGPSTSFETKLLDTTLATFLLVVACVALDAAGEAARGGEGRRIAPSIVAGFVFGIAALARPVNGIAGLGAAAWFACTGRWRAALALAACVVLPIAPVAWQNAREGGGFVPVNSSEGLALLSGNHPGSRGVYALPPGYPDGVLLERETERERARQALGREPTAAERRDHSIGEALAFVRESPRHALGLAFDKLCLAVSWRVVSDNDSFWRERERFGLLPFDLAKYGLPLALVVLGAAGLVLRPRVALVAPVLVTFASLVVFFVTERFRVPAVPFLCVAAAAWLVPRRAGITGAAGEALDRTPARISRARRIAAMSVGALVLAIALGSALADRPIPRAELDASEQVFDVLLDLHAARTLSNEGATTEAAAVLARSIAAHPDQPAPVHELRTLLVSRPDERERESLRAAAIAAEPESAAVHEAVGE